jgi:stress response protein SCP2
MQKINDQESQQLQELRTNTLELVSTLGELSYQKTILDFQITECKDKIKELKQKEINFFNQLKQSYGNIVLNIETGELTSAN